jgi:hypothetical protein
LTGLSGDQTMSYTEFGDPTPFRGSQTMKVAIVGGQIRRGLSAFSIFSRNKILSVFFDASVVTQNTLSFSRITRALINLREGDYS